MWSTDMNTLLLLGVFGAYVHVAMVDAQSESFEMRPTFDVFKHQLGHCAPLRIQLWATLIQRIFRPTPPTRTVRYQLYTRRNAYSGQTLEATTDGVAALQRSEFNASQPVRIIIHGWSSHDMTCSCAALKDAYLSSGDINVVLVDWSDYAMNINYAHVVLELGEVAQRLSAFTVFLNRHAGVPFEQMYLIGHSAGSHIAGLAGKRVPPPAKYGVIYALDPAGPIHVLLHSSWRLMPDDAHYVEAVHTDVALFGYDEGNIAHASFFANWGLGQPHCPHVTINEPDVLCDHFSAVYYFAESLQHPNAFGALRCDDFESLYMRECRCAGRRWACPGDAFMGGEPATPKSGVFYFSTNRRTPFGYGPIVRMKPARPSTVMAL